MGLLQLVPNDLSGYPARNVLYKPDLIWALIARESLSTERNNVVFFERNTRAGLNVGLYCFAGIGVRYAHHSACINSWVLKQNRFDFGRKHVETRHDDQVFEAVY
jgi:hypothetical protein